MSKTHKTYLGGHTVLGPGSGSRLLGGPAVPLETA
jgi:hypothetical protein